MMMGENTHEKVEVISSGSVGLDHALGVGGYPRGRIVEIYGTESSGKTTLAITAIAAIREKLRYSKIPKGLQGVGISFIITGLMGIAFMAFMGIKL